MALLALIAGTVSYLHMHMLVASHGQPGWVAALTPLSVDGMILAASATLLADSRSGRQGGVLPWALLVAGSVASLAANVAVAEPSLIGRVIAAWPSFALTASFELLTRQVRRGAAGQVAHHDRRQPPPARPASAGRGPTPGLRVVGPSRAGRGSRRAGGELRRQAWHWALAHRGGDGPCPAARRLLVPTACRSGGAGLSRTPGRPVRSAPSTHNYRDSPLTRRETVLRPDVLAVSVRMQDQPRNIIPDQHDGPAGQLVVGGNEQVPVFGPGEDFRLSLAPAVAVQPVNQAAAVAGLVAGQPGDRDVPGASSADPDSRAIPRSSTAAASATGRIRPRRRSSRRGPSRSSYLGPGFLLPHLDRVVAFDGPPRAYLAGPAAASQQVPDSRDGVLHLELPGDQVPDAGQRPPLVLPSGRQRPGVQHRIQRRQLPLIQPAPRRLPSATP